ncbi:MAG: hypothetical protein AVDCRST_MAG43-782 [uncultured Thermomicrobiales bacterium]|uniref:Uncharacterized protein n=1 Tax=uncultured Thermomicrobiales bacterium TaxID=1645740 RepID=A0A6J4UF49_9BACT|nr:MAG: hypothetical protein AVDCRST_MAG43-782 [uncultured Thermomicrobiales bacterium]
MTTSSGSVVLGGRFVLPVDLRCVRCDHPLTYSSDALICEQCDTILQVIERRTSPDSCPECGGETAWMGGMLVCSPVPHASCCSQGFVQALPALPRSCDRCGLVLTSSNRAFLCYPCAVRSYVDLRPAASRIYALDNGTEDGWREIVGFSLDDSLWATSGPVAGHPGFRTEFFAVGIGNAAYLEGQLICALPPWSPTGGPTGTVWLVRICCPSGMVYEVAFPAGWIGDLDAGIDDRGRRTSPLPERMVETQGIGATVLGQELRTARRIINAMPRNVGAQKRIDPDVEASQIITTIRSILMTGEQPNMARVGRWIHPWVEDPRDSLKKQLSRIHERSGLTWDDLKRTAAEG